MRFLVSYCRTAERAHCRDTSFSWWKPSIVSRLPPFAFRPSTIYPVHHSPAYYSPGPSLISFTPSNQFLFLESNAKTFSIAFFDPPWSREGLNFATCGETKKACSDPFPGQVIPPQPPILVTSSTEEGTYEEWELLEIVDCRRTRGKIEYKATYIGPYEEWNTNPPWQPWTDFENSKDAVLEFHRNNPDKPKAPESLTKLDYIGDEDETTPPSGDGPRERGG